MLEEYDEMPIHPVHNQLLSNNISEFVIKETKPVIQMQNTISALLKDTIVKKNIQIQFDTTQLESIRNQFHQNTFSLQQNFYHEIDDEPKKEDIQIQLVHKFCHFEIFSDIAPSNYAETHAQSIEDIENKMPDIIKKIKKRVKIDQMRETFYINRARKNMTAWLFEQVKPVINEEKQINGKGAGLGAKQKLKRDLQSISNYDKKAKQTQQEALESKVNYSHILNVQTIIEMQQSFFPPRKTYPIKLYYPLKDNCCHESSILPPSNKIKVIRMAPKRLEEHSFDSHLTLGSTFIIKMKNLLTFFQYVTQKGSDFVYIQNQMDMDYFQVKVLYDYISKVFKLSKVHKEQRRRSLQKKDRVQVKMQEIKQHLKNIFKDLYEQAKIETLFQTEEIFISFGDIQQRVNSYFHPLNSPDDIEVETRDRIEKAEKFEKFEKVEKIDKQDKYDLKDEDYDDGEVFKGKKQRKGKQSSTDARANTRSNNQTHKMLQNGFFFS